jgi:hypothetical protein
MPKGIIKMFNNEKGFGSSNPTMEVTTFSFMSQRCARAMRSRGTRPSSLKLAPILRPGKPRPSVSIWRDPKYQTDATDRSRPYPLSEIRARKKNPVRWTTLRTEFLAWGLCARALRNESNACNVNRRTVVLRANYSNF